MKGMAETEKDEVIITSSYDTSFITVLVCMYSHLYQRVQWEQL